LIDLARIIDKDYFVDHSLFKLLFKIISHAPLAILPFYKMQKILLLKEKTQNNAAATSTNSEQVYEDPYEKQLLSINCIPTFIPTLKHGLLNILRLSDLFKEGSKSKYWGMIVTSQRAVETLKIAWNEAVSGNCHR
jgi:hypothetical protein